MGIRNLAEAIILQSIEDLWDLNHKSHCLTFFNGEGFNICAGVAGIKLSDRMKLLRLIVGSTGNPVEPLNRVRGDGNEYSIGGR